jgi:hemolysin activation/secretion protein
VKTDSYFSANPYQVTDKEGSSPYLSGFQFEYKPSFTDISLQGGYQKGQFRNSEHTNSYNVGLNVPIIPNSLYALYGINGYDVRNSQAGQNYRGSTPSYGFNYSTPLWQGSGWNMNASASKQGQQKPQYNIGFSKTY